MFDVRIIADELGSGLKGVQQLSAVTVTSGPGLAPCLDVGLRTARQICLDNPDIAFLQINHLEVQLSCCACIDWLEISSLMTRSHVNRRMFSCQDYLK